MGMVAGGGAVGTAIGIGGGVGVWLTGVGWGGVGVVLGGVVTVGGVLAQPNASSTIAAARFTGVGPLRGRPAVRPGSHVRAVRVGGTFHTTGSGYAAKRDP